VVSTRQYTASTGRLDAIETGAASPDLQSLHYKYYADGSVFIREDRKYGLRERFEYDGLGRLDAWMKASSTSDTADPMGWSVTWEYDDRGNLERRHTTTGGTLAQAIEQKYNGGAAAPHRLDTSDLWPGKTFGYDPAGNVTNHPDFGTVSYTPFNLPRKITSMQASTEYLYDAFGTRVQKRVGGTGGPSTTYVGGLYERRRVGFETIHILYVPVEGRVISQVVRRGADEKTSYIYSDHLGSTQAVHEPDGTLREVRQDPFGNSVVAMGVDAGPSHRRKPSGRCHGRVCDEGLHRDGGGGGSRSGEHGGPDLRPEIGAVPAGRPGGERPGIQPGLEPIRLRVQQPDEIQRPHRLRVGRSG
jgi:YD repeat-containing protein